MATKTTAPAGLLEDWPDDPNDSELFQARRDLLEDRPLPDWAQQLADGAGPTFDSSVEVGAGRQDNVGIDTPVEESAPKAT
jgi:hypothetical protein